MKKILTILLALTLVFALVACTNEKDAESNVKTSTTQSEVENTETSSATSSESIDVEETSSGTETQNSSSVTSSEISKKEESSQPTHSHTYSDATCTEAKKCSCGATVGKALGHTWNKAICTMPKTCSVCKTTEGNKAEHKWTDATCKSPKSCSVCNKTEGKKVDHIVDGTTCKWCKEVVPVSPSNIKKRSYLFCEPCETPDDTKQAYPGAKSIYAIELLFEDNIIVEHGINTNYEPYTPEEKGIYYDGDYYYPNIGGMWGEFTMQIKDNNILLMQGEEPIELQLLSDDTLKVISNKSNFGLSIGDILK